VDFGSWLISLIPTNPIAAAANGAMLPLVIFTVLFALAVAHSPADGRDALLRLAAACVSIAALGFGYWWIWVDRERLAWHDRWSGTTVVVLPKKKKA